ncbi:hypothetical protein ACJJTC_011744 [Scirpophaga incertulas]
MMIYDVSVVNTVLSKIPTILLSKWADYSYPIIAKQKKPRLDILSDFLRMEAVNTSTCTANLMNTRWDNKRKYSENNWGHTQTVLLQMSQYHSTLVVNTDDVRDHDLRDLNDKVQTYFSIESMGVSALKPRQNSEDQRSA